MIVHLVIKKTEAEPAPVLFSSALEAVSHFGTLDDKEEFTILAVEL